MRMLLACLSFVVFAPLAIARRLGGATFIFCFRCNGRQAAPRAAARHTLCVVGRRRSGYTRKPVDCTG